LTHVGARAHTAHMTGLDLKLRRVAADVRTKDLAAAMGVTDSRVSYIETRRNPTPEAVEKYLRGLDMCITKSTDGRSAA
jgi:transcriptional regulator with XRE-family HTH domain